MHIFRNQFLDKLINGSPQHKKAKDLRIYGTGLSIKQISTLTNISAGTIRRYEARWNQSKIPEWYFILLRFLSGDLSYFGEPWQDALIHYQTKKMTTPHAKYQELNPMEMNIQSSLIYKKAKAESDKIRNTIEAIERQNEALLKDNELLAIQNNRLRTQLEQKQIVKEQIKKGKVIQLHKH